MGEDILHLNGSPIARVSPGEHFKVSIVPSPYFDVVLDGRARACAEPMAAMAARIGAEGGKIKRRSKLARLWHWWKAI